jgi:alanine racemase
VELRDAGVTLPILVLYPVPPGQVVTAVARNIAVALGGGAPAGHVLEAAASAIVDHPGGMLDVHLELETGLGRGGILPGDAVASLAAIRRSAGVRLGGIWTHMAAADDLVATRLQDARFGAALESLPHDVRLGGSGAWRHLAASGVVLAADVRCWDAARVGLAVYGLVPDALVPPPETSEAAARLRPAMSLIARPVRVAQLPAGHGVSYGPSFVTARPTRIATLPVGYGDGWRRALSDRAGALVRGYRVPLVGRVSMDAVMADVTDVPGPPVTEDDEVVLLGVQGSRRITALELAATCETISYEIVTGMSRRLPRVYHAAGSPVEVRVLAGGRSEWRASSSGMAISATSRSTRS